MTPQKLLILLPTLNEAGCIEPLIRDLLALPYKEREILVLDDQSRDGTAELVRRLCMQNPVVQLRERQPPRGRAHAIRDGLLYGLQNNATHFIEMDADGSHQAIDVPRLVDALETADVCVGSRQVSGGKDEERTWSRRILTQAITRVARMLLQIPVRDINSGFRGYTRRAVEAIHPETLESREPSVVYENLVRAKHAGLPLQEVPITFARRAAGTSKLNLSRLLKGLWWLGELTYRSSRGSK